MELKMPPYPLVAVYSRDWGMDNAVRDVGANFTPAVGWAVGWLIKETKDSLSIAMEYFAEDTSVRHVQTYPRETIVKIVRLEPKLTRRSGKR